MTQYINGNIRVQLLSEDIVRIEYGKDGAFCDENTSFIPNRTDYAETRVAYTEEEARQLILDYENYNVPQDNIVIDTDWRAASDRGIGYDVDTKLFPDMKRFMDFAHAHASRGRTILTVI